MPLDRRVTVVSHGPNCLDGLTCSVVAARHFAGRRFEPIFASNREIDQALQHYAPTNPELEELWITDISWREPATNIHLDALVDAGLDLYWVDHHKSAIDRRKEGLLSVAFTGYVLDDKWAASRLLYDYLLKRSHEHGGPRSDFLALHNLVMLADDVDRWILEIDGSRDLALAVRAMEQHQAYRCLLAMDSTLTYPRELAAAARRVSAELEATHAMAERTRHVVDVPSGGGVVVAAECYGYAGEVAELWGKSFHQAVFALYDHRSDGISLRRSPDCEVDLSRLAAMFGGGGHAAAAGCELTTSSEDRAAEIAHKLADTLAKGLAP